MMAAVLAEPRIALVCSDGELIQRTGTGDRSAFEKLYRRYSRPVFGLALRRLGDRSRAEEAVQETFVSIWRSAKTYKPERGPGAPGCTAWLVTRSSIAAAPATSRRRKRRTRRRTKPAPTNTRNRRGRAGACTSALENLARTGARGDHARLLERALAKRSRREARIPLGTVKTRTRSALMHLAEILDGELE